MMKKRGQGGEAIKYLIIAFVIVVVTFFGYKVIGSVMQKSCNTDLARFEIDMKNLDKTVKFGSVTELNQQIPCDADKIYFFDLDKNINLDYIDDIPLLKDSLRSKAQTNVFVLKDNEILSSFYAGNLDINFPDYLCLVPKFEKINLFVEGQGKEVSVVAGCFQPECTYIPVDVENEQAVAVFEEAKEFGENFFCQDCPRHITSEFAKFVQTKENVEVFRKYEFCSKTQQTNVEILIRPNSGVNVKNLRLYESIPKECINDLQLYLSQIDGEVSIKNDPLIIWSLDNVKTEERVSYVLDTLLSDECRETIIGLGVADIIEGGIKVAVPEIPGIEREEETENTAPSISGIGDQEMFFTGKERLVIEDLSEYADDREANNLRKDLGYSILSQTDKDAAECRIKNNVEFWCEAKENKEIFSDVTLIVSDGELSGRTKFKVIVHKAEENKPPEIAEIADRELFFEQKKQLVIPNLWLLASDDKTKIQELDFSVEAKKADVAECTIENQNQVWCTTKVNANEKTKVTITADDGQLSATRSFDLSIAKIIPQSCDECGTLGLFCSREDCSKVSQGCFFRDSFGANTCAFCGSATSCEDYEQDEITCNTDPCNAGNCEWNGNSCVTKSYCGDGICDINEVCSTCEQDCGSCQLTTVYTTAICRQYFGGDCVWSFNPASQCAGFTGGEALGSCSMLNDPFGLNWGTYYRCYNDVETTECAEFPVCPTGYIWAYNYCNPTCSDGTSVNSCSKQKPLYCDQNANLIDKCGVCGCSSGEECQNGVCIVPQADDEEDLGGF